jgi:hypothetical protein
MVQMLHVGRYAKMLFSSCAKHVLLFWIRAQKVSVLIPMGRRKFFFRHHQPVLMTISVPSISATGGYRCLRTADDSGARESWRARPVFPALRRAYKWAAAWHPWESCMYSMYVDMSDHIGSTSFVPESDEPEISQNPPPVIPTVLLAGWPGSDPPAQDHQL